MGTKAVWTIPRDRKDEWLKEHRGDTTLVKKFKKFERSVTENPLPKPANPANPNAKWLKGNLRDTAEYKVGDVRGLYRLSKPEFKIIDLVDFNWKGNITYR